LKIFKNLVIASLLLLGMTTDLLAQKGGSRPSFSGGGSVSRPSFSGGGSSSSSKPSGSSGSGTTGTRPSFLGGSSSSSSGNSGSRPSVITTSSNTTSSTTPIPGREPTSVSRKPAASTFDTVAQSESKKAASRTAYERSETPASTYKTSAGKEVKLDPSDKESKNIRSKTTNEQWVNRESRETTFYAPYASRPIVYYNDPYHPWMTYWLLSQSIENQALWMHHHQDSLRDSARVDAIYRENAQLKARVDALNNTPKDPTWTPSGVDPDILYDEKYVNASFNPKPKEVTTYEYNHDSSGVVHRLLNVVVGIFILVVFGFVGYLIIYGLFIHRYNF